MQRVHRTASFLCLTALSACQANVNLGPLSDTDTESSAANTDDSTADTPATSGPITSGPATTNPDTTDTATPDTTDTADPDTTSPDTSNSDTADPDTSDSAPGSTTGTASDTSDPDTTTSGTIGDTDTGGNNAGCAAPWTRARTITITNEPEKPLKDFQILLKIAYDEDMNFDFSDLRFFDTMGTSLPYWIESSDVPVNADLWVKVPNIPAADQTTITMCYGNPDAAPGSDGEATFVFFDGFDGDKLDTNKWEAANTPEFSDGKVKITKSPVYSKVPAGKFPNILVEAKADENSSFLATSSTQTGEVPLIINYWYGSYKMVPAMNVEFAGKFPDGLSNGIIGGAFDEANVYVTHTRAQRISSPGGAKSPVFIGLGGLKGVALQPFPSLTVDWVLARKFTTVEPTGVVGPETSL